MTSEALAMAGLVNASTFHEPRLHFSYLRFCRSLACAHQRSESCSARSRRIRTNLEVCDWPRDQGGGCKTCFDIV